ncbi:CHRD domain-containing protein [Aurantivibrio infirmus]
MMKIKPGKYSSISWCLFSSSMIAFCLTLSLSVNAESIFSARLSPLPVTLRTVDKITGSGNVEAILKGPQLTIRGDFKGLSGLASEANIHMGELAIPGPAIIKLDISAASFGEIKAQVNLNAEQITRLHEHGLYIQIHSDVAPEGNLRGWLLKTEGDNNE